jgi:UDP-N-acetylglucosamine 2-epimerase (non-hydrolysing)
MPRRIMAARVRCSIVSSGPFEQPMTTAPAITVIVGTRPDAIKMAPVIRALRADPRARVTVCDIGQHGEMVAPVLAFFDIAADVSLGVMRVGQALNDLFARTMVAVDGHLRAQPAAWVLVHGDTTGAAAAALAAFHRGIPVAHVEAGLRTYRLDQPRPEEFNRRMIDTLADVLFAPTDGARDNLVKDTLGARDIIVTGNTVVDALAFATQRLDREPTLLAEAEAALPSLDRARKCVVVTVHRRESQGAPLARICDAVADIATRGDVEIVLPVHPSPSVRATVGKTLAAVPAVHLTPPLPYPAFAHLLRRADVILSDSGGIQEEAVTLGVPVVLLRDTTERGEAVASGWVSIAGSDPAKIRALTDAWLDRDVRMGAPAGPNPFGDGGAAARIAAEIMHRASA